jgi:hypothetical protein
LRKNTAAGLSCRCVQSFGLSSSGLAVRRTASLPLAYDRKIQYAAASRFIAGVSGILDHPPSRVMTLNMWRLRVQHIRYCEPKDTTPRSRRMFLREVLIYFTPSPIRGRRESRMRAAPAVSCANLCKKHAHEHTGPAEAIRLSLRSGFNAYFRALPGDQALGCHRRLRFFSQT